MHPFHMYYAILKAPIIGFPIAFKFLISEKPKSLNLFKEVFEKPQFFKNPHPDSVLLRNKCFKKFSSVFLRHCFT